MSGSAIQSLYYSSSSAISVVSDTSPQLGGDLDTNYKNIAIKSELISDQSSSGLIIQMMCGETITFGDVGYINSDSKIWLSSANSAATMPSVAMALASGIVNDTIDWLLQGVVRNDAWDWVVGGVLYASIISGSLTQTSVSGTGNQAQVIGMALTQDTVFFNPSYVLAELV